MDAFSYLSVLLSIILGLAITEILQGYRGLILNRHRVSFDATPLLWSALILLFATQAWWASFALRDYRDWDFAGFLVVLVQMGLLYMMAAVVLPDIAADAVDLTAHHRAHHRIFFGLVLGVVVASLAKDRVLSGSLPARGNLVFHAVMALIAVFGIVMSGRRAQLLLVIGTAAAFAVYVSLLFARL